MSNWEKEFQIICEEMKRNGETERYLPDRGKIIWCPNLECSNCQRPGTFCGYDLEYGAFYECAFAKYCSRCQKIYNVSEGKNFDPPNPRRFLPIMKKKIVNSQNPAIALTKKEKACPRCGGDIYTFCKGDSHWTVCINSACAWPGQYQETYEEGFW